MWPWCDRDVTPKTKTRIYHAIVKRTITYAAETWCLEAKTVAKLNSTEMDFWRRSARISGKDKIRNTIVKQKVNVVSFRFLWPCIMKVGWRQGTNKMQLIRCLLSNFYLNMFRALLCPSSGEQDCVLPHVVFCTACAGCGCVEPRRELCALCEGYRSTLFTLRM